METKIKRLKAIIKASLNYNTVKSAAAWTRAHKKLSTLK